jgi:hypothetical protein
LNGSRKVRVLKRDGTVEEFSRAKLAAAMWRAMQAAGGRYRDAMELSRAVQIYLVRRRCPCISSAAILEMTVKVLRRVGLVRSADALELHHAWRSSRRKGLRLHHDGGRVTGWDKSWLSKFVCRSWDLLPATGKIIAAILEDELLREPRRCVTRQEVVERMNVCVAALGLAGAVPVRQYALEG